MHVVLLNHYKTDKKYDHQEGINEFKINDEKKNQNKTSDSNIELKTYS